MGEKWSRLPGETGNAFEAFVMYRDLVGSERSVAEVVRRLGKNKNTVGDWCFKHDWVSRARAFDEYLDTMRVKAMVKLIERDAYVVYHKRAKKISNDLAVISNSLLQKSAARLQKVEGSQLTIGQALDFVALAARGLAQSLDAEAVALGASEIVEVIDELHAKG